jgi:RimJ/RimL family protein N-acetyltransferase
MPAPHLPPVPLETPRLMLRPFRATDLDDLFAYQSRPDVARFLYWDARDRTGSEASLRVKMRSTAFHAEGDSVVYAVVARGGDRVMGEVNLVWLSAEHRQGEFGFVFNPEFHGHGYATEAAAEMLRLGFAVAALHRIVGRCDALNHASARVMRRLGMRREAHFVQNEIVKGQWTDEYVYAMLDVEWRAAAVDRAPGGSGDRS